MKFTISEILIDRCKDHDDLCTFCSQGDRPLVSPDEDVKNYLTSLGLRQPADLQLYSRERRLEILHEAKQYGASIRQLVRLTGISFYIVKEA